MPISDFIKKINRNTIIVFVAVIGIIVAGVLIFADSTNSFSISNLNFGLFGPSPKQIGQKAVDFINSSGLTATQVTLEDASEESGLIKIKIKVGDQPFDSYVTKDEKFLFAQSPIDMSAKKEQKTAAEIKKTDSPMLEAFVVSRCPYGLQMQRAMADAEKNQPDAAQYMKVRYIGAVSSDGKTITAMHGEAEATENLRQICIREEQSAKYWDYVACQMKSGDTAGCEKSTGIDSAKLNSCIQNPDKGVAYAKIDFDLAVKYTGSENLGSPALFLNEEQIDENNFGGRSSDGVKSMICAGFNSQASFCSTKLNTSEAAASFSETYEGTGNSGNNDANCAPAQ